MDEAAPNPDTGDTEPPAESGQTPETQVETTESTPDATTEATENSEAAEADVPAETSNPEESKEPKEANFPPIDPAAGSDDAKADGEEPNKVCSGPLKI